MKISFDFDCTLSERPVQEYAKDLIQRGIEVWIVTSRFGDDKKYKDFYHTTTDVERTNTDVVEACKSIGISPENVHFTNLCDKWHYFVDSGFIWHLDDDWAENDLINSRTTTAGIDYFDNPKWRDQCEELLKGAI
jgi:hypothetical protein